MREGAELSFRHPKGGSQSVVRETTSGGNPTLFSVSWQLSL